MADFDGRDSNHLGAEGRQRVRERASLLARPGDDDSLARQWVWVAQRFVLDGFSPWVTGGEHAKHVVLGGSFVEHHAGLPRQILVALPTNLPGVRIPSAPDLVALTAIGISEYPGNKLPREAWWYARQLKRINACVEATFKPDW